MRRIVYTSIAAVLILFLGIYVFWHPKPQSVDVVSDALFGGYQSAAISTAASEQTAPLGPHRQAPAGQSEYYNAQYRFSLFYPNALTVKEHDEGSGAMTITFQNVQIAQGFQVFVVPYSGIHISDEQFKKDEPSGVREGAQNIAIDGAEAMSFYSTNAALGDTAEIWFIHGGYLFEVTTLKPLAPGLSDIMLTWQFL